jgi:uncharacterized protein YkwD
MNGNRQAGRLALVAILSAMLLLTLCSVAGASGSAEADFVSRLNAERAQRGLPALSVDGQLTHVARDWSDQMIASGGISHRPNLRAAVTDAAAALGENVGRSALTGASEAELVARIHRAFMDSPGHRHNVLGDWTHVGVGVRVTDGGSNMWVTVNFKAVAAPSPQPTTEPEPTEQTGAAGTETARPQASAAEQDAVEVESGDVAAGRAVPQPQAAGADEVEATERPLVSTALRALSPAIRAHFALHDPRPLPRQLAGYLVAL